LLHEREITAVWMVSNAEANMVIFATSSTVSAMDLWLQMTLVN